MALNILALIFGLAVFGAGIILMYVAVYNEEKVKWYPALLVIGVAICVISFSFTFVPSGHAGIRTRNGRIQEKAIVEAGAINWHTPFIESIHFTNVKRQEMNFDEKFSCETSNRAVTLTCENVSVVYRIVPEKVTWIWINIEEWDTKLLKTKYVESGLKAATQTFDESHVTNRVKLEPAAAECIQEAFDKGYGEHILEIISCTIGNISFSEDYEAALESKAQAQLDLETSQLKNQKEIEKAEADAKKQKIAADAENEIIKNRAAAEAEANRTMAESLTPEVLKHEWTEKWNGTLGIIPNGSVYVGIED